MKKAFLVTANVTTRVVIEVENDKLNGKEYDILVLMITLIVLKM